MPVLRSFRRQWPWSTEVGLRWAVSSAICGVAIIALAWRVGDTDHLSDQLTTLSLAILAVIGSAGVHVTMVLRGRRTISLRRQDLIADSLAGVITAPTSAAEVTGELVTVPGMRLYHRPQCPMVDGRRTEPGSEQTHHAARRQPCGICRPGEQLT